MYYVYHGQYIVFSSVWGGLNSGSVSGLGGVQAVSWRDELVLAELRARYLTGSRTGVHSLLDVLITEARMFVRSQVRDMNNSRCGTHPQLELA